MATMAEMAKVQGAGWKWCIAWARRELFKQGRGYNFDRKHYRRYVAEHLSPFENSSVHRSGLLAAVRRHRNNGLGQSLTYWQMAAAMVFNDVWEGYWWKLSYPDGAAV